MALPTPPRPMSATGIGLVAGIVYMYVDMNGGKVMDFLVENESVGYYVIRNCTMNQLRDGIVKECHYHHLHLTMI